jgi:hypothetical protein
MQCLAGKRYVGLMVKNFSNYSPPYVQGPRLEVRQEGIQVLHLPLEELVTLSESCIAALYICCEE